MATRRRPDSPSGSQSCAPLPAQSQGTQTIGVRDLRADMAALVRRAGSGEDLIISVGGRPVAHLGPIRSPGGAIRLEDLIASGLVIAPRRTGPMSAPPPPVPIWQGSRIDRALHEIR